MIRTSIAFCLQQRAMVITGAIILLISGILSFEHLPVQAFPDVQNVYVQIVTQFPGQAPEEVEKLVTLPVEREMTGLPHLINIRSVSIFGLSVVTMTFDDHADDYFSRQEVNERLRDISLPSQADARMGPLTTGVGEIFRYRVMGERYSLSELRSAQDWVIERRLRAIPGVADVVAFGGGVKEYQVRLDPDRLKDYQLSAIDVYEAIASNNANTGGGYIEHGYEALVVRGIGQLHSPQDIGSVVIASRNGVPVYVHNVAQVEIGMQPRTGIVGFNDQDDVVEGVVLMLKGSDSIEVLHQIKAKIAELNEHGLQPGMQINPFYDRSDLIHHAISTVEHNMLEGSALILAILIVFIRRIMAALIVLIIIPLSLLFAFILVDLQHISANLISLGAIDFGIIVDSAVVLVEAVMVRMTLALNENTMAQHWPHLLLDACAQMGRPILFSKAILITAFLPIFTFQRVEAKIFSPMAWTLSFALLGSLILSLTLIPVLLSFLLGPRLREAHNPLVLKMEHSYRFILEKVLKYPRRLILASTLILGLTLACIPWIGTEFMPKLDEGNIWLTINLPPPVSLSRAKELERDVRQRIMQFDEVRSATTQLGRPEDGMDPKGFNNLEILIDLKPKSQWRYSSKAELVTAMQQQLEVFPGLQFNFSQVIQDNVEEAISGVKGEIAVKVFGPDLRILQEKADQIVHIFQHIQGATDIAAEQQAGLAQMAIEIDREQIARYGVSIEQVENLISIAVGGKSATTLLEGEQRYNVTVRLDENARNAVSQISDLVVLTPTGGSVPLAELASIKIDQGASRISREDNMRRIAIKCNLSHRDQGSFVHEAQALVKQQVDLPNGYRLVWSGQFENQSRAMQRLAFIVPVSLLLIFVLLFWAFKSMKNALIIVMNVPFALIGGLTILLLTQINLSISAAVGFIALFGIAVQNGVILISSIQQLEREGQTLEHALLQGSISRLRPVVMTTLMAMLGLLPAALSTGIGSETAKPFAVVIIGGLITASALTLTLLPVLYRHFRKAEPMS